MVWLPRVTWKLWLTGVPAAQLLLPACVAWIVQVPTETRVTVAPDTAHSAGVVDAKLTARPDDALALTVNGVPAAQLLLPACVAWIVQVPTETRVTVAPDTAHSAGVVDAKLTARPDDALALTVNGVAPNT